jgi:hypothetical protein
MNKISIGAAFVLMLLVLSIGERGYCQETDQAGSTAVLNSTIGESFHGLDR